MKKTLSDTGFFFAYAWNRCKSCYFVTFFNSIFSAVLPLINIIGIGSVVSSLESNHAFENTLGTIIIFLSVNLLISVIKHILGLIAFYIMRIESNKAQFAWADDSLTVDYHCIQDNAWENLRRKSMFFATGFVDILGKFLEQIIGFSSVIYIVSVLSPAFVTVIFITSSVIIAMTFAIRKNEFKLSNDRIEDDRKLEYLYSAMTGYKFAKEVRINNAARYLENKYQTIFEKQLVKLRSYFRKALTINLISTIVTVIQTASMYFYFSYQVYSGQISIAHYTVLLGTATMFASILLAFFDNISLLKRDLARVRFYREYRDMMDKNSIILVSGKLEEKDIDFKNADIKFENVSFTYPNSERAVLKNINIHIRKGEKIGIVGLNGSGKTTFVKLLARIYDPSAGTISVGETNIRQIPYNQYNKHIGIVLQDFTLFAYSVKENIVFDREFDEKRFNESIEKSGLEKKINSLKYGIDTSVYRELDDEGVEFSGGEGQKLALARAVYKDAEILILDEPTSALDPVAEYELFSRLNDIAEDKTTLFISHRLSSTKFCDRIFVFDSGEIVECGNHTELLNKHGIYAELFSSQAKYYTREGQK